MRHRPLLASIVVAGFVFGGMPGVAAQPGVAQPPDQADKSTAPPVEIVETNRQVVEFAPRADVEAARSIDGFSEELTVLVGAGDLESGSYEADILVVTDDPANPRLSTGVALTVVSG